MTERSILGGIGATWSIMAVWDFYKPLLPFFLLGVVLIGSDMRWGLSAAKKRIADAEREGRSFEKIRTSRAVRRSINKLVDYILWVTIAGLFGQTFGSVFGVPLLAFVMIVVIYGIEVNSCYNNYFEARGIKGKINIFRYLTRKTDIIDPNSRD